MELIGAVDLELKGLEYIMEMEITFKDFEVIKSKKVAKVSWPLSRPSKLCTCL